MMRHRPRQSAIGIFSLGLMTLVAGGCLPRGEPPSGQQLLSDPTASLLSVIRRGSDGNRQVLFFRPSQRQDPDLVDLWSLSVDANGAPSTERMLLPGIASGLELSYRPAAGNIGFPIDARGRVYVVTDEGDDPFRIDPATGDKLDLGVGQFPTLSPSGQRVLTRGNQSQYTLYEADDSTVPLEGSMAQFLGETLFYLSPDCSLMRLVAGGAPEQVTTGVASFYPLSGAVLLVQKDATASCDSGGFFGPSGGTPTLLDTATLQQTSLPDDLQIQPNGISPDGRWLIGYRYNMNTLQSQSVIFDRVTGTVETAAAGLYLGGWRPGHDEIWSSSYDENQPGLAGASLTIVTPGQPSVTVPGVYPNGFDQTGTYWLSRSTPPDQLVSSDLVGLADDPTGPRYHAVPEGSSLELCQITADGRLVVGSYTSVDDFRITDYQIVDPRNGATNTLALRGFLSALGNTRLLGIFHYTFERGDLTSVDFATGHQTIVAGEFAMAAIADTGPSDADPFAPGASVVYQFRARYDSPWSGLWLTTVP